MSDRARVTQEDRLAALEDAKDDIRNLDPNLGGSEVERRAAIAVGLAKEGDQPTAEDLAEASTSRTKKAAQKTRQAVGKAPKPKMPTGKAQRIIFGVMVLTVGIQLFSDIIAGRNRQFDVVPRRIFAGSLAGILLMLLAVPLPKVSVGLASLMALTALLYQGQGTEVLAKLANRAGANIATVPSDNGQQAQIDEVKEKRNR